MDAADIFRQGLGSMVQRPPLNYFPRKPPIPVAHHRDDLESDAVHRIAHTLTACCRCRQRKTRCDPTLPRCLPCERSGSTCEYFDTTKGKKISRFYVVKLQEKVRQLEADLSQFTDEDNEYPRNNEEMVRPGGMVRLNETDETPRYLGPSSGIAMTRLLMEEAKRYTESNRIADLIPEVRERRIDRSNRMQSVVSMAGSISGPAGRKKSYPMVSAYPAPGLPSRHVADKLVEIFNQRAHIFTPTLHEKIFADDLNAVFVGDTDPYKNFVVRMVMAISLQKLDTQYAGLADSYYLAAMQQFEEVVRPKDLRTLQCLVLIGQYSLLTPTRTAVYYVIGLATRICQQMGLGEEKTIALGISDPQTLDMRRRLSWIVTTNEFGLSHIMGRPNGFAKGDDLMDVNFFETVGDEDITPEGIRQGPICEKKLVAIHFCKMRLLQAELRRMLYEKSRPEPNHESHPWFIQMEQKLEKWRNTAPEKPEWCKPWFTGRYYSMIISLYRPSPQVPKPTSRAAMKCFDAANYIINLSSQQVSKAAVDITWIFLLSLYSSLNALLWTVSYREVREKHPREELEKLVDEAVAIIDQCSNRWPGSSSASQLYTVLSRACLQSYDAIIETPILSGASDIFNTPSSFADASSPDSEVSIPNNLSTGSSPHQAQNQSASLFNTSPFGYVFNSTPEDMAAQFAFDPNSPFQNQPAFRSNSIFFNPATDPNGRRFSYFPPDFTHSNEGHGPDRMEDLSPPGTSIPRNGLTPPPIARMYNTHPSPGIPSVSAAALPTPPESLAPPSANPSSTSLSPRLNGASIRTASPTPTPTLPHASPVPLSLQASPSPVPGLKFEATDFGQPHQMKQQQHAQQLGMPPPRTPAFTIPPPRQPNTQQRALPTMVTDWFNPPPPFISPHAFSSGGGGGGMNTGYWGDGAVAATSSPFSDLGFGSGGSGSGDSYTVGNGRGVAGGPPPSGLGVSSAGLMDSGFGAMFTGAAGLGDQYSFSQERHGSLSQEQQLELMDVLETEGLSDIDTFLNMGMGLGGGGISEGGVRWG
ncbi:fungal-specific transcription factor domain-containing protein [Lasiosphaeria miniovina]|uniref:Fungal-specific transcription factor domain-containing protein n=1 Tax=Lasiosphaeria miniovina TaxID=1954250 RepID=A0AA40ALD0_9PEZI|nr:fungal-specific transcription factor domain-containing protein [Lasiosphaeria miniovina]KAK0717968.1 fungal-specific transcription factor domain-containing protein [Lasiosphaeria miniovina]